jgi:hypothetical protein
LIAAGRQCDARVRLGSQTRSAAKTRRRLAQILLNIANPWTDKRLLHGKVTSRRVISTPTITSQQRYAGRARSRDDSTRLYGLDNPKIPMLLVDFRD